MQIKDVLYDIGKNFHNFSVAVGSVASIDLEAEILANCAIIGKKLKNESLYVSTTPLAPQELDMYSMYPVAATMKRVQQTKGRKKHCPRGRRLS